MFRDTFSTCRNETELEDATISLLSPCSVLDREYLFVPNSSQFGEGDLLLQKGDRLYAVECKYIDKLDTGRTARVRRTQKRQKVSEQAIFHASHAKLLHPDMVVIAMTVTNEGVNVVRDDISLEEATLQVEHKKTFKAIASPNTKGLFSLVFSCFLTFSLSLFKIVTLLFLAAAFLSLI